MNAFNISSPSHQSELKFSTEDLQKEMNRLQKVGIVSNVRVQQIKNHLVVKEFVYNWNGVEWDKL